MFEPDLSETFYVEPHEVVTFKWVWKGVNGRFLFEYNVTGDETNFPISFQVQTRESIATFNWEDPDPGPEDFFQCRMRARAEEDPSISDKTAFPVIAARPINLGNRNCPRVLSRVSI